MITARDARAGTGYALIAYLIWGFFPVYWKQLDGIPALQLIAHRIVWSFILLALVVAAGQNATSLLTKLNGRVAGIYTLSALLIGVNWYAYVWAVTHELIVEASLGYFINPLLSVLLGVLIFREKLRRWQWPPIVIAATGVIYLALMVGSFPWLAILLAVTFGLYGVVKKAAPMGSLFGLTVETAVLFLPALGYLIVADRIGTGAFMHTTQVRDLLMVGAGLVTALPLLLFAAAASRVPLTTIGILQYITPSVQFLIGVLVYGEVFPVHRLVGFGLVWTALLLFWIEGVFAGRGTRLDAGTVRAPKA